MIGMADQGLEGFTFANDVLHKNSTAPLLQHFTPLFSPETFTPRDRFGNKLANSRTKAYFDRSGDETKAALLMSPEGEAFLKTHKSILHDIDRGLIGLDLMRKSPEKKPYTIDFGMGRKMGFLISERYKGEEHIVGGGGQSEIYVLEVEGDKYLIKKKTTDIKHDDISQPYMNEMLQCQALAADLEDELDEAGAEMPTFLFASGQMACRKFEEGKELERGEFRDEIQKLAPAINDYFRKQQDEGQTLWKHIKQDMFSSYMPGGPIYPNNNWLKKDKGKYVCIDPVFYLNRL